jgi:uncharacterized protein with FMN-binding domain
MKPTQKLFTVIGSVAVVAAAGWTGYALFATPNTSSNVATQAATSSNSSATDTTVSQNETTSTTTSSGATGSYKDGTYTASTSYMVPHGGQNSLSATITVAGGSITAVTVNDNYSDRESGMYVSDFESAISSSVKGQSLANVSVSRVGGASLTSEAFNSVLDTIRSDAKG